MQNDSDVLTEMYKERIKLLKSEIRDRNETIQRLETQNESLSNLVETLLNYTDSIRKKDRDQDKLITMLQECVNLERAVRRPEAAPAVESFDDQFEDHYEE